jgi:glycolate oxidase FAD binding subunit
LSPAIGLALLRQVWSSPLESTGLGFRNCSAFIRLEGSRAALNEKVALLRNIVDRELDESAGGNEVLREIASGYRKADSGGALWRVHLPPASTDDIVAALQPKAWSADWAGALLWLAFNEAIDLRAKIQRFAARAIRMRGDNSIPPFAPELPVRAALTRRIKAAFDPLHLFNPGRMWEGI